MLADIKASIALCVLKGPTIQELACLTAHSALQVIIKIIQAQQTAQYAYLENIATGPLHQHVSYVKMENLTRPMECLFALAASLDIIKTCKVLLIVFCVPLEATVISNLHPVAIHALWAHTATFRLGLPLVHCVPKVLMQVLWEMLPAKAVQLENMATRLAQAIYRWRALCVIRVHTTPSGQPHYAYLVLKVPTQA